MGPVAPSDAVRAVLERAVARLAAAGAEISQPAIDWPGDVTEAAQGHAALMLGEEITRFLPDRAGELSPYLVWQREQLESARVAALAEERDCAQRLYAQLEPVLRTHDALLCPTTLVNDVGAEQMPWERMEVNGVSLNTDYDWVTTHHFNMLGQLPVLTVPVGRANNGMPVGVQVVARSFDDLAAFRAAAFVEAVMAAG